MLENRKSGRPTKHEQVDIQKTLRVNFQRGIGIRATAQSTGINVKTVSKYYAEWTEQLLEFETQDYLERTKSDRARIINSFDDQITEAYRYYDKINKMIEKEEDKVELRHLLSLSLDTQKYIASLQERKGSYVLAPIIDQKLREEINRMNEEHASS